MIIKAEKKRIVENGFHPERGKREGDAPLHARKRRGKGGNSDTMGKRQGSSI